MKLIRSESDRTTIEPPSSLLQLTQLLTDGMLEVLHVLLGVAKLIAVDDDRPNGVQVPFAGLLQIGYGQFGKLRLVLVCSLGGSFDVLVVGVEGG